jgi:hypothetical protein
VLFRSAYNKNSPVKYGKSRVYYYDKEGIEIYEDTDSIGNKIFRCYKTYPGKSAGSYNRHDIVSGVDEKSLKGKEVIGQVTVYTTFSGIFLWPLYLTAIALPLILLMPVFYISGFYIFEKARRKWWEILIPIYNSHMTLKITGRPWWWIFLLYFPPVSVLISIITWFDISRSFGKKRLFAVLGLFVPLIALPVLAFDNSRYSRPEKDNKAAGIISIIYAALIVFLVLLFFGLSKKFNA